MSLKKIGAPRPPPPPPPHRKKKTTFSYATAIIVLDVPLADSWCSRDILPVLAGRGPASEGGLVWILALLETQKNNVYSKLIAQHYATGD